MSSKTLADMQAEVHENNLAKGWFDQPRTFGEGIALVHSELSEALEAYRKHGFADVTAEAEPGVLAKPEGVGSEFADTFIRLLDECERAEVDLTYEFERKMAFNRTRDHRHGGRAL